MKIHIKVSNMLSKQIRKFEYQSELQYQQMLEDPNKYLFEYSMDLVIHEKRAKLKDKFEINLFVSAVIGLIVDLLTQYIMNIQVGTIVVLPFLFIIKYLIDVHKCKRDYRKATNPYDPQSSKIKLNRNKN